MAELLRNDRDFQVEDPYTKKAVRGMDPEVHIRRLQHFGEGVGIDIAGVDRTRLQPKHLDKSLTYDFDHLINNESLLTVDIHDEGIHVPRTLLSHTVYGAPGMYGSSRSSAGVRIPAGYNSPHTYGELTHRRPYHVYVHHNSKGMLIGVVDKDFYSPEQYELDDIITDWNKSDKYSDAISADGLTMTVNSKSIQSAIGETQKGFRVINSRRGPVAKEAQEEVEHIINNPDPRVVDIVRRNMPHSLSSQFVKVSRGLLNKEDIIDLDTGTWAKIDPEGYFPD